MNEKNINLIACPYCDDPVQKNPLSNKANYSCSNVKCINALVGRTAEAWNNQYVPPIIAALQKMNKTLQEALTKQGRLANKVFIDGLEGIKEVEKDLGYEIDKNTTLKVECKRLNQWISDLQSHMYINCVYCGHRYGPASLANKIPADILREHVEKCPKHPLALLKKAIDEAVHVYDNAEVREFREYIFSAYEANLTVLRKNSDSSKTESEL